MNVTAKLAASNLVNRKTRSTVSILSVALGIILVVVMVGISEGTLIEHAKRTERIGADIILQPPGSSALFAFNSGVVPVKLSDKIKQLPGIRAASPVLITAGSKVMGSIVLLWGIDADTYGQVGAGVKIVEGRMWQNPFEVVIDTVWAASKKQKVGDTMELLNRDFKIVGIRRAGDGGRILIPITTLQEVMSAQGKASFFLVSCTSSNVLESVADRLRKELPGYLPVFSSVYTDALKENAVALKQFIVVLTALSIIMSFLVILLAMYTSIIERTKEIGILKAIGASKLFIVRAIMLESTLLCTMGILVGYALSFAIKAYLNHRYPSLVVDITLRWMLWGGFYGMMGGIVGALYPAIRAARLDPVQTLVFE